MKGFALNENGDVIIENGRIKMIDGNDLLRQTVRSVLGTNKKEWFLNEDEGIRFGNILKKNPDRDVLRSELLDGLHQVDETFQLVAFDCTENDRKLTVAFRAQTSDGETVSEEQNYA